jgi:hypothetical protein
VAAEDIDRCGYFGCKVKQVYKVVMDLVVANDHVGWWDARRSCGCVPEDAWAFIRWGGFKLKLMLKLMLMLQWAFKLRLKLNFKFNFLWMKVVHVVVVCGYGRVNAYFIG